MRIEALRLRPCAAQHHQRHQHGSLDQRMHRMLASRASASRNCVGKVLELPSASTSQCRHHHRRRRVAVVVSSNASAESALSSSSFPADLERDEGGIGTGTDGSEPEHWREYLGKGLGIGGGGGDDDSDENVFFGGDSGSAQPKKKKKKRFLPSLRSLFSSSSSSSSSASAPGSSPGRARELRKYLAAVRATNALEPEVSAMSDGELRREASRLRERAQARGNDGDSSSSSSSSSSLDALLPRAFALVREASRRTLGLRPYDVQLVGACVLHAGGVAEMGTGEGKTLVAVLAAFLNSLTGKGVHIITVNDYLAKRDREWVGKPLELLGLDVAVVTEATPHRARAAALSSADVCWVTAQQLAFTFLRDNSAARCPDDVAIRRPLHYAIVDEADSVLIDECRTPMIISGAAESSDTADAGRKFEVAQALFEGGRRIDDGGDGGDDGGGGDLPNSSPAFFLPAPLREAPSDPDTGEALPGAAGDFTVDRRRHRVALTPRGAAAAAAALRTAGLLPPLPPPDDNHGDDADADEDDSTSTSASDADADDASSLWSGRDPWGPYLINAIKANVLYKRDVHYIVRGTAVKIVDPATGRVLRSSRWTDGIHQAVEAKERTPVRGATHAQGQVTFQTLFRKYRKLGGMSGTARAEAEELFDVYGLDVVPVPPHRPSRRVDHPPRVFFEEVGKHAMLAVLLESAARVGRPVLLGTRSVEDSERLSRALNLGLSEAWERLEEDYPGSFKRGEGEDEKDDKEDKKDEEDVVSRFDRRRRRTRRRRPPIEHALLNAKPERAAAEAAVVAQAGLPGAVTVATSMAGRGTDVLLGGNARGLAAAHLARELGFWLSGEAAAARRKAMRERKKKKNGDDDVDVDDDVVVPLLPPRPPPPRAPSPDATRPPPPFAQGSVRAAAAALSASPTSGLPAPPPPGWDVGSDLNVWIKSDAAADDDDDDDDGADDADDGIDDDIKPPKPTRAERAAGEVEAALLVAERIRAEFLLRRSSSGGGGGGRGGSRAGVDDDDDDDGQQHQRRRRRQRQRPEEAFEEIAPSLRDFARSSPTLLQLPDPQRRAVVVAALVLWQWYDLLCSELAEKVRAAGGLVVVAASVLDSKRAVDQLLGRCGRQGDPGETWVVVSAADDVSPEAGDVPGAMSPSWLERVNAAAALPALDACASGAPLADAFLALVQRRAEEHASSARREVKEYDEVVAVFRDHVYALRRALVAGVGSGGSGSGGAVGVGGGEGALSTTTSTPTATSSSTSTKQKRMEKVRSMLLRGYLSDVAADIASRVTRGGTLRPSAWDVASLVEEARSIAEWNNRNPSSSSVVLEAAEPEGFEFPSSNSSSLTSSASYFYSAARELGEAVREAAEAAGRGVRVPVPRAVLFRRADGGGGGGNGDDSDEGGRAGVEFGVEEAAERLRRGAVALAEAALASASKENRSKKKKKKAIEREGDGEEEEGTEEERLAGDARAAAAFLLRGGRSLRGALQLESDDEKTKKKNTETTSTTAATRDSNLVAARALALLLAREFDRAASERRRGVACCYLAASLASSSASPPSAASLFFDAKALERAKPPPPVPGPEEWQAAAALSALDDGWGDFLADAAALERAVALRAFSSHLAPLEEFRLEAGELFVRLLRRYRRRVAAELLGGPELVVGPAFFGGDVSELSE